MTRAPGYAVLAVAVALYTRFPAAALLVGAAGVVYLAVLDVIVARGVDVDPPTSTASLAPIPAPRPAAEADREVQSHELHPHP